MSKNQRQTEALLAKMIAQQDGILRLMEKIDEAMRLGLIRTPHKRARKAGTRKKTR